MGGSGSTGTAEEEVTKRNENDGTKGILKSCSSSTAEEEVTKRNENDGTKGILNIMIQKPPATSLKVSKFLLWEIIKYSPKSLCILDITCKRVEAQLYTDISCFHNFLEEIAEFKNVRGLNLTGCQAEFRRRFRESRNKLVVEDLLIRDLTLRRRLSD